MGFKSFIIFKIKIYKVLIKSKEISSKNLIASTVKFGYFDRKFLSLLIKINSLDYLKLLSDLNIVAGDPSSDMAIICETVNSLLANF
jgi:hypothetical protein